MWQGGAVTHCRDYIHARLASSPNAPLARAAITPRRHYYPPMRTRARAVVGLWSGRRLGSPGPRLPLHIWRAATSAAACP